MLLIIASYAFIGLFNVQFLVVLLGYSVFIYLLANHCDRFLRPRLIYILLGMVIIGLLVVFKYYAFFRESIQASLASVGLQIDLPTLSLLLPVGLSYYSFHSVSYVVSVQRNELPKATFSEVILYLCFFPSIVSGPINRASHFLPQIQDKQRALLEPRRALFLIALAMVKLLLFSAWLEKNLVDSVFSDPGGYSAGQNLLAVYAYSWNIYFNFSGYTDLVTGIALFLGFRLPVNFNAPYLAANLKEFWGRWHISLSCFIRDFIYIPLGGSRKGLVRTQINVLIAMVISGLWHGAASTFLVWGGLHGLGMIVLNLVQRVLPAHENPLKTDIFIIRNFSRFMCFHFVCLAWIFFRSDGLDNALLMLHQISILQWHDLLENSGAKLLAAIVLFFIYPILVRITRSMEIFSEQMSWILYPIVLAIVLGLVFNLSPSGTPNFIYASF